jgi:hypothetical protein
MTKVFFAALIAIISLIGPSTMNAEAKHWHGGGNCGGFGNYPGNSYFGHHHRRGNGRCGGGWGGYTGYNGYNGGYGGRGTIIDRLVGNGYRRGYY